MEDHQIIELFFARDEDAIRQTNAVYGRRLHAISGNVLRNNQDAQECVNDTYLRAWNAIPPERPRHFFGYLAKICRNLSLDRLDWKNAAMRKAEVVSLTAEMECCIPGDCREMDEGELGRILDAFLRSLSRESRLVFLRRYWFGDTLAEIGQRYGISESAVRMRLNRTKERLRKVLEKEGIQI